MPTYVYECSKCSQVFEAEQRITEEPLTQCGCGSVGTVTRLIQPITVVFNGPGFHVNDYSGAAAPAEAPSCSGTPADCPKCESTDPASNPAS